MLESGIADEGTNATEGQGGTSDGMGGDLTAEALRMLQEAAPVHTTEENTEEGRQTIGGRTQDPKRIEYWQSRADKFRKALSDVEPYLGVVHALKENPEVLERIERELQSPGPKATGSLPAHQGEPAEPKVNALKKPVPPVKPERYDEMEAYSDVQSESFKYRKELEKYRDERAEYLEQREDERERALHKMAEEQTRERQMQSKMQQVHSQLTTRYGLSPVEAQDFLVKMQRPESLTLDNLVALYKMQRQSGKAPGTAKATDMKLRQERVKVPLPAGAASSQSYEGEVSDEEKLVAAFRAGAKARL
jgi:hypothetical protein